MSALIDIAILLAIVTACVGAGRALLVPLGTPSESPTERIVFEFSFGVGVIGWAIFFVGVAGLFRLPWLMLFMVVAAAGLLINHPNIAAGERLSQPGMDRWLMAATISIALIVLFDIAEALAPPADADTLAYHFASAKRFLDKGRLDFVPRAVDGASPMLLHMTYVLALGMGGERVLTLWAGLLGWMPAVLSFTLARRYLNRHWALVLALVFVTTPAVLYGGGSGQVEVKIALFAVSAMICAAVAVRTGDVRYAALAGLAAGFFLGSKYNGFIFAAACGAAILLQRRWFSHGLVFGICSLVAGGQWYIWNYIQSGDPFFPLLYDWFGAVQGYWSDEANAFFKRSYFAEESGEARSLMLLFAFPFRATLAGLPIWDSGRTGLGPYGLLLFPFVVSGLYRWRQQILNHPLAIPALITGLFYVVWLLSGTSQRVRHLLPVYPIFLLCITLAAVRFADRMAVLRPLVAAVGLTLLIQFGGAGVFALNYVRFLVAGESRQDFLERNVARYGPVPWINQNLRPTDRILVTERQLVYHLDIPVYGAYRIFQNLVDLRPGSSNPKRFLAEIRRLGITHILLAPALADVAKGVRHIQTDELAAYTQALVEAGCARVLHTAEMRAPISRTVPTLGGNVISSDIVALDLSCRI